MAGPGKALLVFFNGRSNAGGAERMVGYLEDYLQSCGLKTEIIDEAKLKKSWLGQLYWKLFNYRHFAKRRPIYLARFASAYAWWRKRPGQYWVSNGESAPFFPVDLVVSQGCYHVMERAYGRKEGALSRISQLQMKGIQKARQVIAVTEQVKRNLVKYYGIPPEKISIVANRVDTSFFPVLHLNGNKTKTILYAGRLEPGKGLDILLSLARAIEASENWKLLVACNNAYNTELFSAFRKTEIKIGLQLENINVEAYSLADIVLFPSKFESFGMVTIEALSAGIPVLATPVGIIPDMAERHFPGVYVLRSDSGETILRQMEMILDDFRTVDRAQLHQQVEAEFGIGSYRKRLTEVIGNALKTGRIA